MSCSLSIVATSGPIFRFVEEISWNALIAGGGFTSRIHPLLVKGAVRVWPAWERWSFESLAELQHTDGAQITASFQNGLVEQGQTREPITMSVAPYLLELAQKSATPLPGEIGLLSDTRRRGLKRDDTFQLDWSYMKSFKPDRMYLAQWNILDEFPILRNDIAIRDLWPGLRWTWEFVFIGPEKTVTGLHYDFPNNWFCQVRGTKEVLLFGPDQTPHLCRSKKYDWGATLSDIDISRLDEQPEKLAAFSAGRGIYARVEAGDALFIPRRTWHAVVAMEPCISLAVFGLTPSEILIGGGAATVRDFLHRLRLYRWGNCTCHKMPDRSH